MKILNPNIVAVHLNHAQFPYLHIYILIHTYIYIILIHSLIYEYTSTQVSLPIYENIMILISNYKFILPDSVILNYFN